MCKHALGHGKETTPAVSLYYHLGRSAYLLVGGLDIEEFSRKLGTWKDQLSSYGHKVLRTARLVPSWVFLRRKDAVLFADSSVLTLGKLSQVLTGIAPIHGARHVWIQREKSLFECRELVPHSCGPSCICLWTPCFPRDLTWRRVHPYRVGFGAPAFPKDSVDLPPGASTTSRCSTHPGAPWKPLQLTFRLVCIRW
jgi:hypothetical protein